MAKCIECGYGGEVVRQPSSGRPFFSVYRGCPYLHENVVTVVGSTTDLPCRSYRPKEAENAQQDN